MKESSWGSYDDFNTFMSCKRSMEIPDEFKGKIWYVLYLNPKLRLKNIDNKEKTKVPTFFQNFETLDNFFEHLKYGN